MAKYLGDYFHTNGPLVIATDALRKAMMKRLAEADRKKLFDAGKKSGPIHRVKIGGETAYVLPDPDHTRVVSIDNKGAIVLVRRKGYFNPKTELPKVMDYEPGWTTEPWKPLDITIDVPKAGFVLFDAMAQYPDAKNSGNTKERGKTAVAMKMPAGKYVVEHVAEQTFGRKLAVQLLYLHPKDHRPPLSAQDEKPGAPDALVIDKAVAAAAKKLKFTESEGGPLVFMPERIVKEWRGIETKDYDRACAVRGMVGTLKVGDGLAVVLTTPDSTAVHQHAKDIYVLRWVGADHGAALLAAALGPGKYKPKKLELVSKGEPWVVFDSGDDGKTLKKSAGARITIPKGRYRIDEMDEWTGDVVLAGKQSEVMAGAVRLTRI